jgi:HD-GYP domain-containing protein (c-di-GMP phosphodiesterase class II)
MVLAMPVMHPQIPGHVLLKPGAELDGVAIQRLAELQVHQIVIEFPPTAFLLRYSSPAIMLEQAKLAGIVGQQLDRVASGLHADFEFSTYLNGVRGLIQTLVDDPAAAVFLHDVIDSRSPIASHSFNVGFLSLLMGLRLDGYLVANRSRISAKRSSNIENLGLGGLLHDIGMLRLSPDVFNRWVATGDETDESWQKHVALGFQFVRGNIPPTAAAAVLHHHQRLDGSGFPKKMRGYGPPTALYGAEIHVYARVIAVADVFDRFRHPMTRLQGTVPLVPTVRALKQTLDLVRARKLDLIVYKALLSVVPAFAPGSIVTLSDSRRCIVTGWEPSLPCAPMVQQISTESEELLKSGGDRLRRAKELPLGEVIDLAERKDLRVVEAEGQKVTDDLFEPLYPGEFDLRLQYPSPLSDGWESVTPELMAALTGGVERAGMKVA